MKKMNWRLPTKEELNLMYKNLYKKEIGGFAAVFYWSSSEYSAHSGWGHYFSYGGQKYYFSKYGSLRVRAVRDFESEAELKIGERTTTGIIFSREWDKYVECAFEDLTIDGKEEFSWYEALDYYKDDKEQVERTSFSFFGCIVWGKNDKEELSKRAETPHARLP